MTAPFPPPNYIPTESTVEGIEIYMPAPEREGAQPHREIVDFKCPQCGATTAYSIADGGLTCAHCGYHEPPPKEIVGKGADEFEFKVETMERAAHGWGEQRSELACQSCGAHTSVPLGSLTHTCAFCNSNKVVQREAPQDLLRPRFLIPFEVQDETCRKIAGGWFGNHWMLPKQLRSQASLKAFTPIYLPYWTFDAHTDANWKAEVGHEETERYYDHDDKEWKTRTVIVWKWESGRANCTFDDLLEPGTDRLRASILAKIGDFKLSGLLKYEPHYLAGMQAQAYDVLLDKGWERARNTMRERTRSACRGQASTSRIRNFSMDLTFSDESWRYVLLPVYLSAYTYDKKVFQVMVSGQTGAIGGQRPVDWTKIILAMLGALSPGLLLGIIGVITLVFGGIGMVIGGVGFVLLIIGLVFCYRWYREGMEILDEK